MKPAMKSACESSRAYPGQAWLLAAGCILAAVTAGGGYLGGLSVSAAQSFAGETGGLPRSEVYRRAAALATLGRKIFNDASLSASGRQACASCHSPSHAFAAPNALPVQFGGKDLRQAGTRAVPSLMYLQAAPQFAEHFFESEDEGDESIDGGPTGGLTWDGRVDRARDQARIPLLARNEMANDSPTDVVAKVAGAPYADEMRTIFGVAIFADPDRAFAGVLTALEVYQQNNLEFYPYSSKYDAYLAKKTVLTAQELRGLALFNDPTKGNCAKCHPSEPGQNGTAPQFTDFGLVALGLPRNNQIPANNDPEYYDLGLCGPLRVDLRDHSEYCGRFKTPSLRNVATRQTFFHNGSVHTLTRAIAFYSERDTHPERWYPRDANGVVRKFDDLPTAYQDNVETEPPFGERQTPVLTGGEIADIAAFLQTLSDGYQQQP